MMVSKKIRWLFVDDVAAGTLSTLPGEVDRRDSRLEHVGKPALSAREGVERCVELDPDVVLLDVRLPLDSDDPVVDRANGAWCALEIRRKCPRTRLLLLSADEPQPNDPAEHATVQKMARAGVRGYISKDETPGYIASAIAAVIEVNATVFRDGTRALWNDCLRQLPHPCFEGQDGLTDREHEVMVELARRQGTNAEIGSRLGIGADAVNRHLDSIREKLTILSDTEINSRTKVAIWAMRRCPDLADLRR